jgi:hypothetical protein
MRRGFNSRAVVQNRIGSVIRFTITSSVAFSTATCSNWLNYQNYWNRTIFRTQTVDFNILSHTLPTKLSYTLQQKKPQELQSTLNSNYGLFGLVITDCKTGEKECSNQRFWYSSKSEKNWKKQLKLEDLSQHPYDLLRNPLPLYTESVYDSPRAKKQSPTGKNNTGDIIGRVYYIRGVPPSFLEDYWRWMQNPLSTSESHKYYCLTTVLFLFGGFASLVVLEFILYRRRIKEEFHNKALEQINKQYTKLKYQFREQLKRNQQERENTSVLLLQKEKKLQDLQNNSQQLRQKMAQLQTRLLPQVNNHSQNTDNREPLQQQLEILRQQLAESQRREAEASTQVDKIIFEREKERKELQNRLQEQHGLSQKFEQQIAQLQSELVSQLSNQSQNIQNRELLEQQSEILRQQLGESQRREAEASRQVNKIISEREREREELQNRLQEQHHLSQKFEQQIAQLKNELASQLSNQSQNIQNRQLLQQQLENLQQQLAESEERELEARCQVESLNSSIKDFNEEQEITSERIKLLEQQSSESANAFVSFIEPDGRDLILPELRKELGLEQILLGGTVNSVFYRDRYLHARGAGILADLLEGNWLKATSNVTIKVLENHNQPAELRKDQLKRSLIKIKNLGIILTVEVQLSNCQDYFDHARLLEINMDNGKKYKFIFDQGMDFIEFHLSTRTYRVKVPTYVTLTNL